MERRAKIKVNVERCFEELVVKVYLLFLSSSDLFLSDMVYL